jgi:predicted  nucleic acid-binding Zn-ribbon protein
MKTMSLPFKLFRLQQIDSQIDQHHTRLQEIEAALGQDLVLAQARLEESLAQNELTAARNVMLQAEEEVRSQRIKIELTESTLYGGRVRNPKELQDLQKEVAATKRYLGVLEDRQIDAMIIFEEMESAHKQAEAHLQDVIEQNQKSNLALITEQNGLTQEVDRLRQERDATAQGLTSRELEIYEGLRKSRRGVAVARVVNGNCTACGTHLSAALLHASRSQTLINRCDTCGRILYVG